MRVLVLLVSCFLTTSSLHAEEDWRSTCKHMASLAGTIMQNRQNGVSMEKQMEVATKNPKNMFRKFAETLVIDAYDQPRYSTGEMQQRAIDEFRDNVYLQCVKSGRPK